MLVFVSKSHVVRVPRTRLLVLVENHAVHVVIVGPVPVQIRRVVNVSNGVVRVVFPLTHEGAFETVGVDTLARLHVLVQDIGPVPVDSTVLAVLTIREVRVLGEGALVLLDWRRWRPT